MSKIMPVEYYPLKVIKKELETKTSCSFYFSVPGEHQSLFAYQTAQFLAFRFLIEGKEYVRSYSIASSPFLDEPLRTTVGQVEGGVVSHYMISQIKEGDTLYAQKPLGEFFRPPKSLTPQHYVLFAAGIGITPLFSILKTVLEIDLAKNVVLVFSIRNPEYFIYQKELEEQAKKFKEKFKIQLILSQREGRLDTEKISQILQPFDLKNSLFYLCGPKNYMEMISKHLLGYGISADCIHTEDFKVIPVRGPKPDENSVFFTADPFEKGEPEKLKAVLDGETLEISLHREKSLLEQLIDQGYAPPFSCTSGSCMTCMAKLKEGQVFQLEEGILDKDNIDNLEILTCQCFPLSKTVSIDYDNL